MKLLLELGADPSVPNADNCTPLLAAAGVGALADGDEVGRDRRRGARSRSSACGTRRRRECRGRQRRNRDARGGLPKPPKVGATLLAEHGADINVWNRKNKAGWTPLMIAQGHRPGEFPAGARYDCRHRTRHARGRRRAAKR